MLNTFFGADPSVNVAEVSPADITLVLCLRAHDDNPWVLDRLRALAGYYAPAPAILVVDFGSDLAYQAQIETICQGAGFRYAFVADYGVYSAARAHNEAIRHVETELIFFTDIDFIATPDLFAKLADAASAAGLPQVFDLILDLPAYHLSEAATQRLLGLSSNDACKKFLNGLVVSDYFGAFGDKFEFVAPYSNCFLISKKFFSIVGGYDETFRGHGSEDFEFFVRAAFHSGVFPIPADVDSDLYGPMKDTFFVSKSYTGFRRLNELFAARAQRLGLQIFHRWHPTGRQGWRKHNDWKRERLRAAIGRYKVEPHRLLEADWLPRRATALCICKSPEHWGYFTVLRSFGYRLAPIYADDAESLQRASDMIEAGEVNLFAIFNPYMKSHAKFLPLFLRAREKGVRTLVVERGALPQSIYYAEDVSYAAESFSQAALDAIVLRPGELEHARAAIATLKAGDTALESADPKAVTDQRYAALSRMERRKVFVPLQLEDDMAVTKFLRNAQNYDGFAKGLGRAIAAHPDTLFIIKPHPLSKLDVGALPQNALVAERSDNVHSLLDMVDAVVCYNSGVGLLAACHGKPVVTVGNAFYNLDGVGSFADCVDAAVARACADAPAPDPAKLEALVAKYLFHRYSRFSAEDDIRELAQRRIHGYQNIRISRPVIFGEARDIVWEAALRRFSFRSFGCAEMNLQAPEGATSGPKDLAIANGVGFRLYAWAYGLVLSKKEKRRLRERPTDFFAKAQHPLSVLGRRLFAR